MIWLNDELVEFASFANGEYRLGTQQLKVIGHNVVRLAYRHDIELWRLHLLMDHLRHSGAKDARFDLNLDYLPYSRADRDDGINAFSLRSLARLINDCNFDQVSIVEPHSDVSLALIDYSMPIWTTPMMAAELSFDAICYPDAGAQKRYANFFTDVPTLVGYKHRDPATGHITSLNLYGSPKGSRVVILDDLCSYGWTFSLAAKQLRALEFDSVGLVVSHCEPSVHDGELLDHIDFLHCTDSMGTDSGTTNKITVHPLVDWIW